MPNKSERQNCKLPIYNTISKSWNIKSRESNIIIADIPGIIKVLEGRGLGKIFLDILIELIHLFI